MITNKNIVSISEMRKETDMVMKKIEKLDLPIYLFSRSEVKAVMITPEKYAMMQEMIEDYLDQKELLNITDVELESVEDWKKVKSALPCTK